MRAKQIVHISVQERRLRRIFGPNRKWRETGEDYIMRSFIMRVLHQILLG